LKEGKLHIAFVANTSWSIYNFRLGVIRKFIDAGNVVYALAPRDAYTEKLIAVKVKYIDINLDNYSTNPIRDLRLLIQLVRIYRKHRFNKVFHYTIKPNIYGSLAASIIGLSSISVTTGLGKTFSFKNWFAQKILLKVYKLALRNVDEIWTLNQSNYNTLIASGLTSKEKSYILPSEGINTQRFRPSQKKKEGKIFRFLYAGRLLRDKGVYDYVNAARIIKQYHSNVKCEILGFLDPNNKNAVKLEELNLWQEEGIIKYLGSTEDVRPYIDRAECIVFPSFYQEGVSRILLEAASMSTPIITSDHVGCREVVIDKYNGFLMPPRDVTLLTQKMGYILQLPVEARKTMGGNGRRLVKEKYDERKIINIYKQVLKGISIQQRELEAQPTLIHSQKGENDN
jgi:glycosyltransferase involved in cell wall biosynthesis